MLLGIALAFGVATATSTATAQAPAPPNPGGNQDMEILTRGPVHEAFAVPVVYDPQPGMVVPKEPPAPVEEMRPDE